MRKQLKRIRHARPLPGWLPWTYTHAGPDVTLWGVIEGGPDDGRTLNLHVPNDEALAWAEAIQKAVARNRTELTAAELAAAREETAP